MSFRDQREYLMRSTTKLLDWAKRTQREVTRTLILEIELKNLTRRLST
jgi:hypothetical protein